MKFSDCPKYAALAILSTGLLAQSGESKDHNSSIESRFIDLFRARFSEMAKIDLQDGKDEVDEKSEYFVRTQYLDDLKQKDPESYQKFLVQLELILQNRPKLINEMDITQEMEFFNLEEIYERLKNRNSIVSESGIVHFPSKEIEMKYTLSDLTADSNIVFEARNPETLKRIGISASGPFKCFRINENTMVHYRDKFVSVSKGDFVTQTSEGDLYKMIVLDGDRIRDSLSEAFLNPGEKQEKAPDIFEKFLNVKMPKFSLDQGRFIFNTHFTKYRNLLETEYRELLIQDGIPFEKHFVYFIQWASQNQLPPSEASMRLFLDTLLKELKIEKKEENTKKKDENIIKQALDSLFGRPDQDENRLSYHDQRVKEASQKTEILRKKFSLLFAIIRLQGDFFDQFTYNRLSENYSAHLSSFVIKDKEYLLIVDIRDFINLAPSDIQASAKPSNFVQRLNLSTTYNRDLNDQLVQDLSFSESHFGDKKAKPKDFTINYQSDGSIVEVLFKGKPYNPDTFVTSPERLKQIPNDSVSMNVGGVPMEFKLQDYFDQYHALEKEREGSFQSILLYDVKNKRVTRMRNPMWFVEGQYPVYQSVANSVMGREKTPTQKLLKLARWLQGNFDYLEEALEVNKLTMATFMDRGGDCEDSFTAFKTLAENGGLGSEVGAVIFDKHIAPIVRGRLGPTVYPLGNDTYTIFELATSKGKIIPPGETSHKNPILFVYPNGKIQAATDDLIPVEIVPLSDLNPKQVQKFNLTRKEFEDFIADPRNQASKNNLAIGKKIIIQAQKLLDSLHLAFAEIAKTGEIAETIFDQFEISINNVGDFIFGWDEVGEKEHDDKMKELLQKTPEKFKVAWKEFRTLQEKLNDNIIKAAEIADELIEKTKGKEDTQTILRIHNQLVNNINQHGISLDLEKMQVLYNEKLKYVPNEKAQDLLKYILKGMEEMVQELYNQINVLRAELNRRGVR